MIEKIGKDKARLRVSVGSGKKRKVYTKTVTYSGKKDLDRQYRAYEEECRKTPFYDATLEDIIKSYIDSRISQGAAPTTVRGYNVCLGRISADLRGEKASKVLPIQIEDYIAQSKEKYSPKTIKNDISLISSAYTRAIKLGLLDDNPCRRITLPKQTQDEIATLSETEIVELLSLLENEQLDFKVGYLLCLFCGMRRSEVLGLKEEDIDFERKCIYIHQTRHIVGGKSTVQPTKTVRSTRTLAVPDFMLEDIDELIKTHHSYEFDCSDFLILTEFGEPMNPTTFTMHLKRNYDLNITVHGLRHTFATMLNAQGFDIARISAELGHSNIHTTFSKYMHVFGGASESSKGIADAINKKFGK